MCSEQYLLFLGHSLKAPVGRWQKGKDLTWYAYSTSVYLASFPGSSIADLGGGRGGEGGRGGGGRWGESGNKSSMYHNLVSVALDL